MSDIQQEIKKPLYRKKPPSRGLEFNLLVISGVATSIIATIALSALLPNTEILDWIKIGLIGVMAGVIAYSANRFAIDKGAPLAATGFTSAGLTSIFTILFIGLGLFASTYAGLTIASVDELRLQAYGRENARYVGELNKQASQATRTLPVIRSIAADLRSKVQCEIRSACLSGRGDGRGPVTKSLENVAGRADQIAAQLDRGNQQRQSILDRLNELLAAYQSDLNKEELSPQIRRSKLIAIDAKIDQELSDLAEAIPTTLLEAYSSELKSGISIPGRANATNAANTILSNHGRSLGSVLDSLEASDTARPEFPARAGVSSTFEYILHFLPIAAITAVVELILPLALWIYVFIGKVWEKEVARRSSEQTSGNQTLQTQIDHQERQPQLNGYNIAPSEGGNRAGIVRNEEKEYLR